jgi:hypothetical protein
MNKFAVTALIFFISIAFSSLSQATLITNLTQTELDDRDFSNAEDHLTDDLLDVNYINYKGYDWAWVSPVNVEIFGGNTLYAPELQKNWLFADESLLNILKTELTLADFTADNGDIIQSAQFFNSTFEHVDDDNFGPDALRSELTDPNHFMVSLYEGFETFYVRKTNDPTLIPEPSILMIFAFGLITLASRKKLLS